MSSAPASSPAPPAGPRGPDEDPAGEVPSGWRLALASLRLMREGFWIKMGVTVVVLSVAFVMLGRWQYHRHLGKVVRNQQIDENYTAAPVPLSQVLAQPDSSLPGTRQWTPVQVTGVYESEHAVAIRNRPLDGNYGYEVVVPLRTATGAAFLVDRGWVPPGQDVTRPDSVPPPPTGEVTVVARLRPGEPPVDETPPPGQEMRIDLGRIATVAGGAVYRGAYGVLASEQPSVSPAPALLPRPDEDLGPHLAYAFQWWAGAVAAFVLIGVYLTKEARIRGGGDPGQRAVALNLPRLTSRRSEPTDEEWEDAADG
jgi:cytochrome oxidase assembly protein ShyY1